MALIVADEALLLVLATAGCEPLPKSRPNMVPGDQTRDWGGFVR